MVSWLRCLANTATGLCCPLFLSRSLPFSLLSPNVLEAVYLPQIHAAHRCLFPPTSLANMDPAAARLFGKASRKPFAAGYPCEPRSGTKYHGERALGPSRRPRQPPARRAPLLRGLSFLPNQERGGEGPPRSPLLLLLPTNSHTRAAPDWEQGRPLECAQGPAAVSNKVTLRRRVHSASPAASLAARSSGARSNAPGFCAPLELANGSIWFVRPHPVISGYDRSYVTKSPYLIATLAPVFWPPWLEPVALPAPFILPFEQVPSPDSVCVSSAETNFLEWGANPLGSLRISGGYLLARCVLSF